MNRLKLFESKKLHYKKYLYKLRVSNPLTGIFRTEIQKGKRLEYARSKLEDYLNKEKNGDPLTSTKYRTTVTISSSDLHEAYEIYKILSNATDEYMLRCEYQALIVYTNNRSLLDKISKKITSRDVEIWEPDQNAVEFLKNNTNVIIVNKVPEFPYKITLGKKPGKPELANWIEKNSNKVQIGSVLLNNLKTSARWIQGQYFYVKDENVIFLMQIMIGDNIGRIDKLVYKADIDK